MPLIHFCLTKTATVGIFLFRQSDERLIPMAFDFSRAWIILGLPFGIEIQKQSRTLEWWIFLKEKYQFAAASYVFDKIENLPKNWLELVLNRAPLEWTSGFDVTKSLDFWANNRSDRCRHAKSML